MILTAGSVVHIPTLLPDGADVSGGPVIAKCAPILMAGVKPVAAAHYVPSSITGQTAVRTLNDARMAFPADVWDVSNNNLTIDFIVEQNSPFVGQVGLFGFMRQRLPSPYHGSVIDGQFRFSYRMADGTVVTPTMKWPTDRIVRGQVRLILGQTCVLTINGSSFSFAAPAGTLIPRDTHYFGVGAVEDQSYGWGDYLGGPHDWTYHVVKATAGQSSGPLVNEVGPFCRILGDQPLGPIHCHSDRGEVFGNVLHANPGDLTVENGNRCRIHDLSITGELPVGPMISVGGLYRMSMERVVQSGGGYSVLSLGGLWTYPFTLVDCELGSQLVSWGESMWASRTNFQECGAEFHYGMVSFRDTFVAGNPRGGKMFVGRDGCIGNFDVGQADYEGLQPSSYFDFDSSCSLKVTNWYKGKNTPIVV